MKKAKVTVIGAGNVGATCADVLAQKEVCNEVILVENFVATLAISSSL